MAVRAVWLYKLWYPRKLEFHNKRFPFQKLGLTLFAFCLVKKIRLKRGHAETQPSLHKTKLFAETTRVLYYIITCGRRNPIQKSCFSPSASSSSFIDTFSSVLCVVIMKGCDKSQNILSRFPINPRAKALDNNVVSDSLTKKISISKANYSVHWGLRKPYLKTCYVTSTNDVLRVCKKGK